MWPLLGICYTSCLPKFGHQPLNCPSIRYIVPAKIFSTLPLCQKNWFCGKGRLDNINRLLRSKSSSWIHIGVKRISQACRRHHQKNIEKNCKTQPWDEKQNRALFLDHPVSGHIRTTVTDNMRIIGKSKNWAKLCFLESLNIKWKEPSLNNGIKAAKSLRFIHKFDWNVNSVHTLYSL